MLVSVYGIPARSNDLNFVLVGGTYGSSLAISMVEPTVVDISMVEPTVVDISMVEPTVVVVEPHGSKK